jgi:prolyl 4-hydroxylase
VVRYEPNQFYKRHHDQNTALWTPQGPRVLTFFIYLNDPEAGGETHFPSINGGLMVTPKRGDAILWPSVHDERPMEADQRTDHEAMPVHRGIKCALLARTAARITHP